MPTFIQITELPEELKLKNLPAKANSCQKNVVFSPVLFSQFCAIPQLTEQEIQDKERLNLVYESGHFPCWYLKLLQI